MMDALKNYSVGKEPLLRTPILGSASDSATLQIPGKLGKTDFLFSKKHTATGTISMDVIATVDPATGAITALDYQSAEGTWNIEAKAKK